MTDLRGWQLVTVSRKLSSDLWPYSHRSLLGVLFVWLELLECRSWVLRGCVPRSSFLRRKEELQIPLKLGSPGLSLVLPSISESNHRAMPHSRGGSINSYLPMWGRAYTYWEGRSFGAIFGDPTTVCHLITTIYVNFTLLRSAEVLSLLSLRLQRLECPRCLLDSHAAVAVSKAWVQPCAWVFGSTSPLAPQFAPCNLRASPSLHDVSTGVGGLLTWQVRTPKRALEEDKPSGASAYVIIAHVLLAPASHRAKPRVNMWGLHKGGRNSSLWTTKLIVCLGCSLSVWMSEYMDEYPITSSFTSKSNFGQTGSFPKGGLASVPPAPFISLLLASD